MLTVFLIVVGVLLAPVVAIFIWGVIQGFRNCQPPRPSPEELRTLWYDLVYHGKPRPKPKQRFRVVFPPEDSSSK